MTSDGSFPGPRPAMAAVLLCAALGGCASTPPEPRAGGPEAECHEVFRRVDDAVAAAGVADGMTARVPGFPYLRSNRFLASYAGEPMSDAQFADWLGRLAALGRQAHAIEIANLSVEQAEALGHALWNVGRDHAWATPAVAECAARLAAEDLADARRRTALRSAVAVPDDYVEWHRLAGLYWLTRIPFASGIRRWHEEVRRTYAAAPDALPVAGALSAYLPPPSPSRADVAGLLARASANPLGVPDPGGEDLDLLFRLFAPAFVVDTASDADRPGELGWAESAVPQVISRRPVVYRRLSHARYHGRALLQLNYSIWFPERPRTGGWDLLGGHLDGVLWRVTLSPDGEPWLFDTMHLCGCYHQFYPTALAAPRPQPDTLDETAFVPQSLDRVAPGTPVVLRLAAGTHYVDRVITGTLPAAPALEYLLLDDDSLRSVAMPGGGRRGVFRPDGIVPGTERAERWLFWPMGVPEPGAMRQWGRHATAFVGRRHFDDPALLERYFMLKDVNGE